MNILVQLLLGFLTVLFCFGIFMSIGCSNYENFVESEAQPTPVPQLETAKCMSYKNKVDCENNSQCKFLSADVISADFANGLLGTSEIKEYASAGGRCFVKNDINNLEKSEYCGIFNGLPEACDIGTLDPLTGIMLQGQNAPCFININKKCKNIAERKGTCKRRCGLELGTVPTEANYEATCSCNSDCVNNNSCCSDYNAECMPNTAKSETTAYQTVLDYGNLYKLIGDW